MHQQSANLASYVLNVNYLLCDPSSGYALSYDLLHESHHLITYQEKVMKAPKLTGRYNVKTKIVIAASKEKVWQVLQDFSNVYTWAPSVSASYQIGDKANGIGGGRHCELDGFGAIDEYITQWHVGEGFVYTVTPLGPLDKSHSSWWLTAKGDHQTELEVVFSYNIRFGLFGKLMHRLMMRKKLVAALPETLTAVKTRVETGALVRPVLESATA
jgi:hypothetical protein